MFVNGAVHHNEVREQLIKNYKIMTKHYFTIIAPRSIFLTTEQLEFIENNPPPAGAGLFSTVFEMEVTIEQLIKAYLLGGDGFEVGYRHPRKEIPIIYETLQESIRLWTDIKLNSYQYQTAPMEELEAMELVAKNLFPSYRMYYNERVKKELEQQDVNAGDYRSVASIYLNILEHGLDKPEDISFISYIDIYRSRQREDNSFTGSYARQNLSIDDIPTPQPRRFDEPKHEPKKEYGQGNWLTYD